MEDARVHFGSWVRWLRHQKGKSQRGFGALLGVTDQRVSDWESQTEPEIGPENREALARLAEYPIERFDEMWRKQARGLPPPRSGRPRRLNFSPAVTARFRALTENMGQVDESRVLELLIEHGGKATVAQLGRERVYAAAADVGSNLSPQADQAVPATRAKRPAPRPPTSPERAPLEIPK
jgi:transcriptional regulator with XRE-family HTH domain